MHSPSLSCPALQWTHCTCAVLLGPLRLPSATPLDLDCWSHRRLATSLLMMCGLAYSPNSVFPGLSAAHYAYPETELRLYSQPLQRVTTEYTHLADRQVDYPVFLSLPLTLSDLALATGESQLSGLIVHCATCGLIFEALCCILNTATVERSGELPEVLH